ncbi:MAG TPA: hypothetical protein VJ983_06175 [candidate division Zixibacteria bacterium]|nr:hypothetical protein [candidate division Zixibacteria bacterium]
MFDRAIITKTHQWWKFIFGLSGLVVGGMFPLFNFAGMLQWINEDTRMILILVGTAVALISFAFLFLSIRCPDCGARWAWMAARTRSHKEWIVWLFSLQHCPKCGPPKSAGSTRSL